MPSGLGLCLTSGSEKIKMVQYYTSAFHMQSQNTYISKNLGIIECVISQKVTDILKSSQSHGLQLKDSVILTHFLLTKKGFSGYLVLGF